MSNNKKGKLVVAPPPPIVVAKLSVTAFSDRPPVVECLPQDVVTALRLLQFALATAIQALELATQKPQADPVDKKREYLGPRKEGV